MGRWINYAKFCKVKRKQVVLRNSERHSTPAFYPERFPHVYCPATALWTRENLNAPSPSSGMRLVIHPLHLTHRQLRIPLRGRQPLMPQHLLDRPQVRTLFQHVRAKRMPQRMRMHIGRQPAAQRNLLHNPPDTSRRQPATTARPHIHQQRPIMSQLALARQPPVAPYARADTP